VNVLLTGAGGLIGSHLRPALAGSGHTVTRAVRRPPSAADEVQWTTGPGRLAPERAFDAVIHLAGHSLAAGRWTAAQKRQAWSSRVDATRALCERLAATPTPPRVMLCASAIGLYGDRGDEVLDESSPPGAGFLADLAGAWEAASAPLSGVGCRVAHLRLGLVLAREGGALPPLLRLARLGLGGPLGSGRQFWSWVAIDDVAAAFVHALESGRPGAVNVVAPEPLRQRDFARVLGRVLRRPAFVPAPAPVLRIVLGEAADALLLASARVSPRRLQEERFLFRHPELAGTLRDLLQTV
jgi:uncharacterized protein (TIGR01777 family)